MITYLEDDAAYPERLPLTAISSLMERVSELGLETRSYADQQIVLSEGEANEHVYIVLKGKAELFKTDVAGGTIIVDRLGPGALFGLISVWTRKPAFTSCRAVGEVECLLLVRERFESIADRDPEFASVLQTVFINNLVARYRRQVALNVRVAKLTSELEVERAELERMIRDLAQTRNRLVHQEKLATMGQLLAGIAHEINNPSSALLKSVETLMRDLPALFERGGQLFKHKVEGELQRLGLESPYRGSEQTRQRMQAIEELYPHLKRSLVRRLAQVDDAGLRLIHRDLLKGDEAPINAKVRFFEIGVYLRSIKVSVERITRLVQSLKNYGRADQTVREYVDVRDCIRDTLVVLNNRLKQYSLTVELGEVPTIRVNPGEINQVVTNLLVNACDATPIGRPIRIECGTADEEVWIRVTDTGPGVPEELRTRIFEPNFTTKNSGTEFGLGLGLAISNDIAAKHEGRITVENRVGGGAVFTLHLPEETYSTRTP